MYKADSSTTQPTRNPLLKRLITGILLLNCIVACMVWFSLQNSKNHYEELAEVTTRKLSRVLDEDISGIFSKVDIALQSVTDEAERQLASGGIQQESLDSFIVRQHSRLPELTSFRATDAAGDAIYGPKTKVANSPSLAHRDYFKQLRETTNPEMVVSKPLVGGISGKWMIILARRINRPDGSFAGVVYAGLGLEYLTKSFKDLNAGANGAISLLDAEQSLIARYPEPDSVGAGVGRKNVSPQMTELIRSGRMEATFHAGSVIDGKERVSTFRKLSHGQPFYITTSLSASDYLEGWKSELFKMLLFFGGFCFCTVVSAWLFYRECHKTRDVQHQLAILNCELEERVSERTAHAENSNKTLQSIIECMSDWVWEVDADGRYTYCSPNVETVLGYTPDEILYKTPFDFMDNEEVERLRIEFGDIAQHSLRIINLENWCIAKDGRRVLLSTSGVPILDETGSLIGYRGIDTDITMQKKMMEDLRESNERFYRTFNNAPTMMWISTLDEGRFIDVNQRFLEISEFSREEMIGKTSLELGLVTHEVRQQYVTAVKRDKQVYNMDLPFHSKSGRELLWKYSGHLIQLEGKNYLLSSGIDITEHHIMQQHLQQAQKMESVGRLAGGVAHDFNNMLTVILGHTEMGLMKIDQSDHLYDNLIDIQLAANRSAELTRQLLAFARKQAISPKAVNLNESVSVMLNMLQRLIGDNILITWHPAPNLWQTKADPSQIDQILTNLCVNARDAIKGTGRITIETQNFTIDDAYCEGNPEAVPGDYVHLSVSDDGSGMDKETMAQVFEPFFTTKGVGKGTGIGLATVYGIVRQNKGFINIYSEPGRGTTFTIHLPRLEDANLQQMMDAEPPVSLKGKEPVLLVEDEPAMVKIAARN